MTDETIQHLHKYNLENQKHRNTLKLLPVNRSNPKSFFRSFVKFIKVDLQVTPASCSLKAQIMHELE